MSEALGVQLALTSSDDFNTTALPSMLLGIKDTKRLYRRSEANGTLSYILDGEGLPAGAPGSGVSEDSAAAYIPAMVAIRNVVQGASQIQAELQAAAMDPAQLDAAWAEPARRRRLQMARRTILQKPEAAASPDFGLVRASANVLGQCGNGVCEFGEAAGSWAYTDEWHCPRDCPFELTACPVQVRLQLHRPARQMCPLIILR